ncbi:ABC transporter ATP-binding protein [Tautonia sociabilis]|uniref:ABC transporter ATP-binding protein n=1 Tax=Tautonia sociabilis TaxID=2080755 RepID=A0A432MHD6_9BACT|nr:ABC transporter ATP-binding protein [Tautonia sociabilis]RUL86204.1 ABC transporter ATP-binding protein [Tautonia sociabilis]
MIVTEGLTKSYGKFPAVRDVSMEVRSGEVFGLLGPNGSGKTTTIRMILGLLRPSSGSAAVAGFDCWRESLQVRRRVSYLPGEVRLPGAARGYQLLKYLNALRGGVGLDRAVALAERVMGLDLSKKVRTFSTGMKQKLALAQAFADPVDVLILDEPTSALDPSARNIVLGLVAEARKAGQTVIFSGHVLSEVEQVADRVAIMRRGRLMHVEDMHERRRNLRLLLLRFQGTPPESLPEELQLSVRERNGEVLFLEHRGAVGPLLSWLHSQPVADLAIGTEDLRTLYDRYHGPNAEADAEDRR